MSTMQQSLASVTSTDDRPDNVVPAHVLEAKRRERAERLKAVAKTIFAQALVEREAAP
jgi:hypothetical protein